jgi:hypothetical protein
MKSRKMRHRTDSYSGADEKLRIAERAPVALPIAGVWHFPADDFVAAYFGCD